MNRRSMLLQSLKLGAAASLGIQMSRAKTFALKSGFLTELTGNPLRFPPVFNNGGTMTLASRNVVVWPGTTTQVTAINGSYPCPTVRVQRGSVFSANVVNQLSEDATVHWHGLIAPATMDGHPKDPIVPGGSFTYSFPIVQRAGTYFYHAHAHMLTAEQVYKGFAGLFIIDDDNEIPLGLPRGDFDIPLVIQDRRSASQPQFTYSPTMIDVMNGYLGDLVLVNGTPDPYFEVSRTLYRFRLVNGSNARVYKIAFADNHAFHIVATDGGLKDQAVSTTSFLLSPGERVDILMDFSSYTLGQNVVLKSLPFTEGGGTQGLELNILRFDITGNQNSGGVVPASLPSISYYNPSDVTRTRTFILTMSMSGGAMHKINNRSFELNRIDEEVPGNQLEEWRIVNGTDEFHPMHIHGLLFQVYSRNGNTNLPPSDKGWKDTVLVNPSETIRTLVKFQDYNGIYLLHCHNLEHEDDGMMMNFRVSGLTEVGNANEGAPSGFQLHQNYPNPFNPTTTIRFQIPETGFVTLKVHDLLGREVTTLVNEVRPAGSYDEVFNASALASGMYSYELTAGSLSLNRKLLVLK
ncbi:MAG: multicopper oxidase domain-containing protein [Ignavibacteriae bacterium]|nr:multicopper oxidase domain-containing protein [Ignavibacteriota bacterium]